MKREYRLYLQDILHAIEKIEDFTDSLKNVPESVKHKHKTLPRKEMAKMRDKISHDYFGVDYEIVWKVLKEKLPPLKLQVRDILAQQE